MLLLRTLPQQTIDIGESTVLTLLSIHDDHRSADIAVKTQGVQGEVITLTEGNPVQLLPRVVVLLNRVLTDSAVRAVLGFEAPTDIRIHGNWNKLRRKGTAPAMNIGMLRNMTIEELISYTQQYGRSSLEKELLLRLEKAADGDLL